MKHEPISHWIDVARAEEFGPGQSRLVGGDAARIAVFNLDGGYYALEDRCSHEGFPFLGCGLPPEDLLEGDELVCPRHGARFCLRTGAALTPPAHEPAATFPVRVQNGVVQVRDQRRK